MATVTDIKEKLSWANSLRAAATFAVIILHVCVSVEQDFGKIPVSTWVVGNLYDAIVRWCVPVFLMITGTFALNNYQGNLKDFFKKAFKRIVLPFIFWSILYLFYYNGQELIHQQLSLQEKADLVLEKLLSGTAVHMWFVYLILSMYLLIPILSKWVRFGNIIEIRLFLLFWFILLFLQPLWDKYDISFDITYFSGYIGYLIMGNYLFKEPRKINIVFLLLSFTAAVGFTCLMTYRASLASGEMDETYLDNLKPAVSLTAISVYLVFKNISLKLPVWIKNIIESISVHSYGIFLVHILVLTLFFKSGFTYTILPVVISVPLISLLCLLISWGVIYIFKKIPVLRLVAG